MCRARPGSTTGGDGARSAAPRPSVASCNGPYVSALRDATDNIAAMRRTSFSEMPCSIARTLDVVGEWWTLLIVRDAFLGVTRFDDWQARLGIARNVLTARLDRLVDHGILERR